MGIITTLFFRKRSVVEDERMLQAEDKMLQKKISGGTKEHVTFALKASFDMQQIL